MYGGRLCRATIRRRIFTWQVNRVRYLQYTSAASENAPSTAPKPLIDVKSIRHNPQHFAQNCLDRNYKRQADYPQEIATLSERRSALQKDGRGVRERNNIVNTQLSKSDQDASTRASMLEEARGFKDVLQTLEKDDRRLGEQIENLAIELPNLTSPETPRGKDSRAGARGYINENLKDRITSFDPLVHDHVTLGSRFNLIDFASAGTVTGWGWYYLDNEAAMLEQALVQYAFHTARRYGFSFSSPPSTIYSHIGALCGFRPRDQNDEQQVYNIQQSKTDIVNATPALSLAGTAEIPLAGKKANMVLKASELPIHLVGSSRCFRAEAGARGQRGRGLYRVHEFTKVEMFAWTAPGAEQDAFNAMIAVQKHILQSLGLYCQILEMPSTDLGASAFRKWDIEAYFPSRKNLDEAWGEVTSTSICTDYQTRRLNTRVKGIEGVAFPSTVSSLWLQNLASLLQSRGIRDVSIQMSLFPILHSHVAPPFARL